MSIITGHIIIHPNGANMGVCLLWALYIYQYLSVSRVSTKYLQSLMLQKYMGCFHRIIKDIFIELLRYHLQIKNKD